MKSCDECKLYINIGKTIILKDNSEKQKTICRECYKKMAKEQKKQYIFVEGTNIDRGTAIGGFGFGGILGSALTGLGTKSGENPTIKKGQDKHGYTQKEMDNFSIDVFDMHTELLNDSQHQAVMDKFEGKTNSSHYRKYIKDKI